MNPSSTRAMMYNYRTQIELKSLLSFIGNWKLCIRCLRLCLCCTSGGKRGCRTWNSLPKIAFSSLDSDTRHWHLPAVQSLLWRVRAKTDRLSPCQQPLHTPITQAQGTVFGWWLWPDWLYKCLSRKAIRTEPLEGLRRAHATPHESSGNTLHPDQGSLGDRHLPPLVTSISLGFEADASCYFPPIVWHPSFRLELNVSY